MRIFIFILMISLPMVVLNAENKKVCSFLDTDKMINISQVCVGDMSLDGKVTEILKSNNGPISFMVMDEQTKEIKKLNNLVLKELGTCASKDKMSFCVGQTVAAFDGSKEIVTGFVTPEYGNKKVFVMLASSTPGRFSYLDVDDVMEQVQISQTGFIKAVGVCQEDRKLKDQKSIKECAKIDLQQMAQLKCNMFHQGNGKITFDFQSKEIKMNCHTSSEKKPLMLCKADSFIKCDQAELGVLKAISKFMSQFRSDSLNKETEKVEVSNLNRNSKKAKSMLVDAKAAARNQARDQ